MTHDLEQLFETVNRERSTGVAAAADELIAAGTAAAAVLLRVISTGRPTVAGALLGLLDVPDRVDLLAPLAANADHDVQSSAIRALARTADVRAVALIADTYATHNIVTISALGDLGRPEARTALKTIAATLGNVDAPDVLAALCERAVHDRDPSDLYVLSGCALSLAKLGDFSMLSIARTLARFVPDEAAHFQQVCGVRLEAVRTLDIAVGPGVRASLIAAISDPDREVSTAAIEATMHAGRIDVVDHWLHVLARRGRKWFGPVYNALVELTGERPAPFVEAPDLAPWWAERRDQFDSTICYRRGKPSTPAVLMSVARGPDSTIARNELQQMIGVGFFATALPTAPRAETAALDAWWAAHQHEFPPGQLHRWGRSFAPEALD